MALLNPKQIYEVLQAEKPPSSPASRNTSELSKLLEKNNLSADEVLDNLSSQMRSAESDSTRLRAAEIALKLNGLLDSSDRKADFNVTINIIDSEFSSFNPILLPR